MEIETLKKANLLMNEIAALGTAKKEIEDQCFLKKSGHRIPEYVLDAGMCAMRAAVDEAIDSAQTQLDAI